MIIDASVACNTLTGNNSDERRNVFMKVVSKLFAAHESGGKRKAPSKPLSQVLKWKSTNRYM